MRYACYGRTYVHDMSDRPQSGAHEDDVEVIKNVITCSKGHNVASCPPTGAILVQLMF